MAEFVQIKLNDMISKLGENEVKSILSSFVCPVNKDVETFIKYKAIEFSKQYLSRTTLVYWKSDDEREKVLGRLLYHSIKAYSGIERFHQQYNRKTNGKPRFF